MVLSLFLTVSLDSLPWYLLDIETSIVCYCSLEHSEDFCSKCCHLQIHSITSDDSQGHNNDKPFFWNLGCQGEQKKGKLAFRA